MIGIRERAGGNFPGEIPVHSVLIHQQPHELRHRNRWVRVVHLDGPFAMEVLDAPTLPQMETNHILQGARGEKVLLLQAQPLALNPFIVRIQDF